MKKNVILVFLFSILGLALVYSLNFGESTGFVIKEQDAENNIERLEAKEEVPIEEGNLITGQVVRTNNLNDEEDAEEVEQTQEQGDTSANKKLTVSVEVVG